MEKLFTFTIANTLNTMRILGHLLKLFSAIFIGLMIPYAIYRALSPFDAFLTSFLTLGLMVSLPLMLVFYGRLQWAKYLFTFIWLAYTAGMWIYMLTSMSAALPPYFWVTALAILAGGAVFLVLLRRGGIDFSQLSHSGKEGFEEETGETEEFRIDEHEPVGGGQRATCPHRVFE